MIPMKNQFPKIIILLLLGLFSLSCSKEEIYTMGKLKVEISGLGGPQIRILTASSSKELFVFDKEEKLKQDLNVGDYMLYIKTGENKETTCYFQIQANKTLLITIDRNLVLRKYYE